MQQVCRRGILVLVVAWAAVRELTFLSVSAAGAQKVENEPIRFHWRVPTAHYQTVKESLVFDGKIGEERNTKALALVVFIGIALLPLRRKLVQPHLKIDARAEIKIDVEPTLILLVDKSGATLYEADQLTNPAELAQVLASAMSK